MKRVARFAAFFLVASCMAIPVSAQKDQNARLENANTVLKEILGVPDNIPQELLDKAECVLVIPSMKKFALGFGASYGRGAITCRGGEKFDGAWSAPAMYRLYQGSVGLQIGGQATDFVLLIMNPRGAGAILKSKVELGAQASVAGGPKGRTAQGATNEQMNAEVLAYSRSRGAFAGISISGANLQADEDDNKKLYGQKLTAVEIVREGKAQATPAGQAIVEFMNAKTPKNLSVD